MKTLIKTLAILALLLSSLACQTTVAPGADPVVVRSQQVLEISFAAVDKFVEWEYKNRLNVSKDVHAAAETLRREFPPVFRISRTLLAKYRSSKDAEDKRLLENYLAKVKEYSTLAQSFQ